jgi:hypothetical protein
MLSGSPLALLPLALLPLALLPLALLPLALLPLAVPSAGRTPATPSSTLSTTPTYHR